MKENFIDLTDSTRLSVRVNFTQDDLLPAKTERILHRIQKKAEEKQKETDGRRKL